jgi:hypothetical protein
LSNYSYDQLELKHSLVSEDKLRIFMTISFIGLPPERRTSRFWTCQPWKKIHRKYLTAIKHLSCPFSTSFRQKKYFCWQKFNFPIDIFFLCLLLLECDPKLYIFAFLWQGSAKRQYLSTGLFGQADVCLNWLWQYSFMLESKKWLKNNKLSSLVRLYKRHTL